MNTEEKTKDRKVILSTLWIFFILNTIYLNVLKILGDVKPSAPEDVEFVNSLATPEMMLFAAVFLELAMVMILLSRLLKFNINRWANIIVATIQTLGVLGSLFVATPTIHVFFVTVEIITLLSIIWLAWSWKEAETNQ